jgi:hypothetical protein
MQVPMKHQKGITVLDISYNLIQDIPRVRTGIPYSFERHCGSGSAILLYIRSGSDLKTDAFKEPLANYGTCIRTVPVGRRVCFVEIQCENGCFHVKLI